MLVFSHLDRPRPASRHLDGEDLAFEKPIGLGGGVFALRGRGEHVARFARDLVVARQVVGGLGHRIGAELALDFRVGKARADRRIKDPAVAAERRFGLVHDKGCAAHALDAAGDHDLAFAAGHRLRRHDDRVEPAAAIALQYRAGDLDRQSGQEPGMPRDAAAVFAGLVGAAVDDVLDPFRVEGTLLDDLGDDRGQHVVGSHPGESAGVPAKGGAQCIVDVAVEHDRFLLRGIAPQGHLHAPAGPCQAPTSVRAGPAAAYCFGGDIVMPWRFIWSTIALAPSSPSAASCAVLPASVSSF